MSEEIKTIKQSMNRCQIVGTLAEVNLEETEKEVELKNGTTKKKVVCKTIGKKEFRNPSLLIEVSPKDEDGNIRYTANVGVSFFQTHEKKLDDKGNIIDNPRFKALQTIMNDYIPKSVDKENATRVKADCSLTANEYATSKDQKNYDFVSFPQLNCFQVTSLNVPSEDSCDGEISGVVRSVKTEMITKNDEQEETGRLIVDFYSFDRNGVTTPTNLIVDKDLADDFSDIYEAGTSCKLFYEVFERQVGGKKSNAKKAFGSREAHITSGYTVTEYNVFSGDEPFEEENEYFVPMDLMKTAMQDRQNYIDTKIADKKKADSESGKAETKKSGLGNRSAKIDNSDSMEELPF